MRRYIELPHKVCPSCKRDLSMKSFNSNRSRPDGSDTICRDCDARRKKKKKTKASQGSSLNPMTTGRFYEIYNDTDLSDSIRVMAAKKTVDYMAQEDLMQDAWIAISMAPSDYSDKAYFEIARRAIEASFRKRRIYQGRIEQFLEDMSADEWMMWERGVYELDGDFR